MEKIPIRQLKAAIAEARGFNLGNQHLKKVEEVEFALRNINVQYLRITKMFNVIKNIIGELK